MKCAAICLAALAAACSPAKPAENPVVAASESAAVEPAVADSPLRPATVDDIKLLRGFYVEGDTLAERRPTPRSMFCVAPAWASRAQSAHSRKSKRKATFASTSRNAAMTAASRPTSSSI